MSLINYYDFTQGVWMQSQIINIHRRVHENSLYCFADTTQYVQLRATIVCYGP